MSIFGFYFVTNLLRETGWPRKQGIRKRDSYDTFIVDGAIAQSVDWAAALGAGRPRLSLQVIAEMYRNRDWDSDEAPDLEMFVNDVQDTTWSATSSPRDAVQPVQLEKHFGKSISPEQLKDARLRVAMEGYVRDALLWGLSNPDRFAAWYSARLEDHESMMPTARRAGLDIDELSPLPEFFADCEEIVRDYERDVSPLPSIPPRLLDDAAALGWRVEAADAESDEPDVASVSDTTTNEHRPDTEPDEGLDARHERENQALMEESGMVEIEVVRNSKGQIVQAAGTYADGGTEVLFHMGGPPSGPVHVSTSRRSDRPTSHRGETSIDATSQRYIDIEIRDGGEHHEHHEYRARIEERTFHDAGAYERNGWRVRVDEIDKVFFVAQTGAVYEVERPGERVGLALDVMTQHVAPIPRYQDAEKE